MNENLLKIKGEPAVQAHINMLQGIINRMASNSANCKSWCLSIFAAVFALFFAKDNGFDNINFLYAVVCLFYFLDCFYLGLERNLVDEMKNYIKAINEYNKEYNIATRTFTVGSGKEYNCDVEKKFMKFWNQLKGTFKAIFSFSTTPFYGILLICIHCLTK